MGLSFEEARRIVLDDIRARRSAAAATGAAAPTAIVEQMPLLAADGRVLAADVLVDRDLPPFDRSTRDGFAVRAAETPGAWTLAGEVRAGGTFAGTVPAGACVEIMTGAPVPAGLDAVLMVEHATRDAPGDGATRVHTAGDRRLTAGENIVATGSEARRGDVALARGARIDHAAIALLATVGCATPAVYVRPRVAILPTGDELVPVEAAPGPAQIRNSNAAMLAAQVTRAGGTPVPCPPAHDDYAPLRASVEAALATADMLLLSGGVSMGKYDLVEQVLADLGAELRFTAVDIRPGKPVVFGHVRGKPFFGLPGNPLSTMCTFTLFAAPALALLGGAADAPLQLGSARLAADYRQRALPLTVFLPAVLDGDRIAPLTTQGSGDLFAMARATCWMIVPPGVTTLAAGDAVATLPR